MATAETTAKTQRGRPFVRGISGNPAGRPVGARNKATIAVETLLAGEAETLTRKVIEMALAGDVMAMRLCLDRILPIRRERVTIFPLPALNSAADAAAAMAAILAAIAAGALSVGEATELAKLVETFIRCLEAGQDAERREQMAQVFPNLNFGGLSAR